MKDYSKRSAIVLGMAVLTSVLVAGCKSGTPEAKPGQDLNPAMSPQQKAVIQERKKSEDN